MQHDSCDVRNPVVTLKAGRKPGIQFRGAQVDEAWSVFLLAPPLPCHLSLAASKVRQRARARDEPVRTTLDVQTGLHA